LCRSADEGIAAIQHYHPQLIFLDIEMPRKNGFEVLQQFPAPAFDVIFTTAYNQFAIKAFRFAALDYLLKPIDADDLVAAVERFDKKQHTTGLKEQWIFCCSNTGSHRSFLAKCHFLLRRASCL
jgi:two-component system LytT family response regulator